MRRRCGRALDLALPPACGVGVACGGRYARRWPPASAGGSIFDSPPGVTRCSSARMRRPSRSAQGAMAPPRTARYGRPMEPHRIRLLRVGSHITRVGDVLIPVVLAGMSLTEIWIERFVQPGFHRPRGGETGGGVFMAGLPGWRGRHPGAVLA